MKTKITTSKPVQYQLRGKSYEEHFVGPVTFHVREDTLEEEDDHGDTVTRTKRTIVAAWSVSANRNYTGDALSITEEPPPELVAAIEKWIDAQSIAHLEAT